MIKRLLIAASLCLFAGCSSTQVGKLYPVEGPMTELPFDPDIEVKWDYNWSRSGPIEIILPYREVCKGEYTIMDAGYTITGFSQNLWTTHWDTTYARPNANPVTATLRGDRGTVIDMYYMIGADLKGAGMAKDNKGNVYKVHLRGPQRFQPGE